MSKNIARGIVLSRRGNCLLSSRALIGPLLVDDVIIHRLRRPADF